MYVALCITDAGHVDLKGRPSTDYILPRWAYNIEAAVGYEPTAPKTLLPK